MCIRDRSSSPPAVAPVPQQAQPAPAPQQFSVPQEAAIDTLAPISVITLNTINNVSAKRLSDIFYNVPGVSFTDRGDSPANSINIRGLQDFGRVAVVVDGARQNYQVTGHNANGAFFLDPALIGGVEVVRGPTANVYGSGAIGGVVAFRTMDTDDIVKRGGRVVMQQLKRGGFVLAEKPVLDYSQADRVVAIDGEELRTGVQFQDKLWSHRPGDVVTLTVVRSGERVDVPVKLRAD